MSHDRATTILEQNVPAVGKGNRILDKHLPDMTRTTRILKGGAFTPFAPVHVQPIANANPSPLGQAIAKDAAAGAAAGAAVNINTWAGAMEAAGVTGDQIGAAYQSAGGDAVLAPAESRGDTSAFLGQFVTGLEAAGVPGDLILSTYVQAGGGASQASGGDAGTTATATHDTPGGAGGSRGGGGFLGGVEQAGQQVENAAGSVIKGIGKILGF